MRNGKLHQKNSVYFDKQRVFVDKINRHFALRISLLKASFTGALSQETITHISEKAMEKVELYQLAMSLDPTWKVFLKYRAQGSLPEGRYRTPTRQQKRQWYG